MGYLRVDEGWGWTTAENDTSMTGGFEMVLKFNTYFLNGPLHTHTRSDTFVLMNVGRREKKNNFKLFKKM